MTIEDGSRAKCSPRFIDLTGQRFGRLTVLGFGGMTTTPNGARHAAWDCICDCGRTCKGRGVMLRHGHKKSCGCLQPEVVAKLRKTHGQSRLPEFKVWTQMRARCLGDADSHLYRDKGISVCDRWRESFENFLADMGPKPSPRHSIDRIDSNGNYEPANCRWALPVVQANNTSRNVNLTYAGETMSAAQWADRFNLKRSTVYARIDRGWPVERVLSIGA